MDVFPDPVVLHVRNLCTTDEMSLEELFAIDYSKFFINGMYLWMYFLIGSSFVNDFCTILCILQGIIILHSQ